MFKPLLSLFFILLVSTISKVQDLTDSPIKTSENQSNLSDARPNKDHALFFAIQDYDHWNDLRNPIKDATAIKAELQSEYGFDAKNIEIVRNPTKRQIYSKLASYSKKNYPQDGQLLIFFSGHGEFRDASKEGFFIPKDGLYNDPFQESYIPHTRLARILDNIPCNHVLLALDACYSGTFDERIAYKGYGKRPGAATMDENAEIVRRQLKNRSRLFITSGGKERTPDGQDHSPFTQRFLEGLRSYGIQDKVLTFNELIGYVELARPTPRYGKFGSHDGGGFVFVTTSKRKPSPSDNNQEETTWQLTTQQNTPTAYRFYLSAFPNGKYKATAETRLKTPPDNMVFIKGGTFTMGCTSEQGDECESKEKPMHQVTLSSYYLGRTEVSRVEFREFISSTGYKTTADKKGTAYGLKDGKWAYQDGLNWENMDFPQTDEHPVIGVSWYDAVEFCNWKSQQEGLNPCYTINSQKITCNWSTNGYRLPTEAEWEFAARSRGKAYKFAWGSNTPNGNVRDESYNKEISSSSVWKGYDDNFVYTSPVGKFEQGDLGLADMTGNVWEWCWDWYDNKYYENSSKKNPRGAESSNKRVLRGGSWYTVLAGQRVAARYPNQASGRGNYIGFRIARAP